MLSIAVAILSGLVVSVGFRLAGVTHSVAGAITPGVIVTIIAVILLMRRIGKMINPVVEEAQRHMQGGRRELALKSLRDGLRFRGWHPLLEPQLRTQIGLLLYDQGDTDAAVEELKRASSRPWESRAFLGCAYFKKRDEAGMVKAFEKAVKVGEKDDLSWTVYAWCLLSREKKAEAVAVLKRALKKIPASERLKNNLELVEEGKKMKVAPYGDRWARFGLDGSKPGVPKAMRGFAQRPGFRQRPQRKR
ncbi:MAG TPA: tetratricopeptide repeat protein [Polyangia bacterium]|nr:tetratricopeptide repeat protein [Polyangia bacterium]